MKRSHLRSSSYNIRYTADVIPFNALHILFFISFHRTSLLLEQINKTICESRSFAESMIHTLSAKYTCSAPRVRYYY